MAIALAILALVLCGLSVFGVLVPHRLIQVARSLMSKSPLGLWIAVVVRVLLAALLWFTAPVSRTSLTFQTLAVLILLTAVILLMVGRNRLERFIQWLTSWPGWVIRLSCLLGVAMGVFLLWSMAPAIGLA